MNSRLFISGDLSMNSRLSVLSDVSMNRNFQVLGSSILNGDVSLNKRLYISGDVSMNSRLSVLSDVSLNRNFQVLGRSIQNGDVSINSRLFIGGDVSMNSRLFVGGDVSLNRNLQVSGSTIQNGDVYMNSRLSVSSDVSLNGNVQVQNLYIQNNFSFGSIPVTKYYNWVGSYNLTRSISETITITLSFTNPFYTKIHMFNYVNTNPANTSSQIVEYQGGYINDANVSQSPNNIFQINRTFTESTNYNYSWNNPTTDKSNIYFTITSQNNNTDDIIYFVLRTEVIQTNNSILYPPYLNSISINDSNNNNIITNFDEITILVNY
jgi:cytoskeletal protein CcmA (bactofilin family)